MSTKLSIIVDSPPLNKQPDAAYHQSPEPRLPLALKASPSDASLHIPSPSPPSPQPGTAHGFRRPPSPLSMVAGVSREPSNSEDSGTEADDEHFLKGLPAPRPRPRKGWKGLDGTPSPLLSPAILEQDTLSPQKLHDLARWLHREADDNVEKARIKLRQRRRIELGSRVFEAVLLGAVASVTCRNAEVQAILRLRARELLSVIVITIVLLLLYPVRFMHQWPSRSLVKGLSSAIPTTFDPATLIYPPTIPILVSLTLAGHDEETLILSMTLAISSLPKRLLPAHDSLQICNDLQWLLSMVPLLVQQTSSPVFEVCVASSRTFDAAVTLVQPLHEALCGTLIQFTTTSLLPAELQLLSISLIHLLLLARSPQAVILKALLWASGIGMLYACGRILHWAIVLARVPKWRFKRPIHQLRLHTPPNGRANGASGSSHHIDQRLREANGFHDHSTSEDDGREVHAGSSKHGTLPKSNAVPSCTAQNDDAPGLQAAGPASRSKHGIQTTRSGRKKWLPSASIKPYVSMTYGQAKVRSWAYAVFVYLFTALLILAGIRPYVQQHALHGREPVGWVIGYVFGDVQRLRMHVITTRLREWICLPDLSVPDPNTQYDLGWMERLRRHTIGEANTRLLIAIYWICVIATGLAIVFRLSAICEVDTRRKVFHFMMVAILLPATYIDPCFTAVSLALVLAIFLFLDLFRACQLPPLSKYLARFLAPYVDGRDLKGPVVISHVFLLIGCAIPLWLTLASLPRGLAPAATRTAGPFVDWDVPWREVSMISGVICVGMGDAAASLIGRRHGRHKWFWSGGKSIEGSAAFACAVFIALLAAKAWLLIGGWPDGSRSPARVHTDAHAHQARGTWTDTAAKAALAATLASLTEAVLTGGNDNVVVPVVLWLCVKGLQL